MRIALSILLIGQALPLLATANPLGTAADRQALVDYLIDKTLEREAFSPVKNEWFGLDVEAAMREYENDIVAATTEEELFYALARLSNARKDRHLSLTPTIGGLPMPTYYRETGDDMPTAGVRIEADYSDPAGTQYFIADIATDPELVGQARPGDRIVAVNGMPIEGRIAAARPYFQYSTDAGFRHEFGQALSSRTDLLPSEFHEDKLYLTLERGDAESLEVALPFVEYDQIRWQSDSQPRYPGFTLQARRDTFDLYLAEDQEPVVLLEWHNFGAELVEDMNWLVEHAVANDLLDYDIVWDGRDSRGGREGPYVIQRLSPEPFRTTLSNLRISDITPLYVERRSQLHDDRFTEWLGTDVLNAYNAGEAYTANVPFKLEHGDKDSGGTVQPAAVHFTGKMACLLGPAGGSRVDQFSAMVVDNDLCHTIGMPTAGYSNASEWEEDVVYPDSDQPVIGFTWSIGQTIRPNGEVLEGNPPDVAEYIPLTRDNFAEYTALLLDRALKYLADPSD